MKGGHNVPKDKIISRFKKSIDNLKELIKLSDICNVYDNSNSTVKRIFKKRKEEYFYSENKFWNKESIINLTGINDIKERNLNNF